MIQRLLTYHQIDPSDNDNQAIKSALTWQRYDIVKILYRDPIVYNSLKLKYRAYIKQILEENNMLDEI